MGFPTRASRAAFGATGLRNRIPVRDPKTAISADIYELNFWQVAGCNVVVPLAWAAIVVDGAGNPTLGASAESWDADDASEPAVIKLPFAGGYRLTYDATYPDENGDAVVTNLHYALPQVQTITTLYHARGKPSAANIVDLIVWDSAGAPANPVNESIFVPIW